MIALPLVNTILQPSETWHNFEIGWYRHETFHTSYLWVDRRAIDCEIRLVDQGADRVILDWCPAGPFAVQLDEVSEVVFGHPDSSTAQQIADLATSSIAAWILSLVAEAADKDPNDPAVSQLAAVADGIMEKRWMTALPVSLQVSEQLRSLARSFNLQIGRVAGLSVLGETQRTLLPKFEYKLLPHSVLSVSIRNPTEVSVPFKAVLVGTTKSWEGASPEAIKSGIDEVAMRAQLAALMERHRIGLDPERTLLFEEMVRVFKSPAARTQDLGGLSDLEDEIEDAIRDDVTQMDPDGGMGLDPAQVRRDFEAMDARVRANAEKPRSRRRRGPQSGWEKP